MSGGADRALRGWDMRQRQMTFEAVDAMDDELFCVQVLKSVLTVIKLLITDCVVFCLVLIVCA